MDLFIFCVFPELPENLAFFGRRVAYGNEWSAGMIGATGRRALKRRTATRLHGVAGIADGI